MGRLKVHPILLGNKQPSKHTTRRLSIMPTGALAKMLANKMFKLRSNGRTYEHASFDVQIARVEYTYFDSFTVQKSDTDNGSIISDVSSTSSGSRR